MEVEIRNVESFDALLELEDEVFSSVCALDTKLNRTYIEHNYDRSAWLMVSDMAWNMVIACVPLDAIYEDVEFKRWLLEKYWNSENWLSKD